MVAACHHVALLSPTAALLKLGLSPYGEGAGPTEAGQVRRGTERGDEPSFRSGGIAKARTSRGTPLSPVDAQHCNSRDFARAFGCPLRHTICHSRRTIALGLQRRRAREEAAPGLGGTSPTPLPGSAPARPARLNLMRVLGQQDVPHRRSPRPASGSGWFGFRAVIWPARETVVRAGKELQGRSSAGGIPTPLSTPRCLVGGEPKPA